MALPHLISGQLASLRPLGTDLTKAETHALLKSTQLEVMRIILPAGKTLPRHRVPGEITVQCLEGSADFEAGGQVSRMSAGDFLHLEGGIAHTITAVEDASLLVTICLLPDAA